MSGRIRRVARAAVIGGLMIGVAPAGSALGQELTAQASGGSVAPVSASPGPSPAGTMLGARSFTEAKATADRMAAEAAENARLDRQLNTKAASLRPGAFVWQAERAQAGPVEMVVSLAAQRIYVYRDSRLIAISTVSTGRPGHTTPTGRFPILQKKLINYSTLYDSAPMPHMQRLTWDGVALHAGRIPGVPASHGCIRLPAQFATLLYGITATGQTVHVVAGTPSAPSEALAFTRTPGVYVNPHRDPPTATARNDARTARGRAATTGASTARRAR
jgi:lipoprotein-anchoring transpeptidase ErfK/SrfK